MEEVERHFRPEFLNRARRRHRLPLAHEGGPGDHRRRTSCDKVRERLTEQGHEPGRSRSRAKDFLIDKGYNPDFGARPLRRAIEHNVEDPLSEEILRGNFTEGVIVVDAAEDELFFQRGEPKPQTEEAQPTPAKS